MRETRNQPVALSAALTSFPLKDRLPPSRRRLTLRESLICEKDKERDGRTDV